VVFVQRRAAVPTSTIRVRPSSNCSCILAIVLLSHSRAHPTRGVIVMSFCGLRTKYSVKVYILLAFLIVDLALNTVIDSQSEKVSVLSMMGTQGVMRIVSLFVMFLFMWETFVFKYGLLGALCQRFKLLFIIFPISFIFLVAVRIFRGVSSMADDENM
jgi:uncharacterized membrane protein